MRRSRFPPVSFLASLALFAAACGGDDSIDTAAVNDIFFAPENADALAHAALPGVDDLPTDVWIVSATDDFGDEDEEDDFDFEAFMANEPACDGLNAIADLGGIFGGGDDEDELPAGRAQIEFEDARTVAQVTPTIEVEIEIEETVSEVEGSWGLVKGVFESDGFEGCMLAAFDVAMGGFAPPGSGVEITTAIGEATTSTPNNGTSMAFGINMVLLDQELDMAMEMHMWPYGNAAVTVSFLGTPETVGVGITEPTLDAVVAKLDAAASGAADGEA